MELFYGLMLSVHFNLERNYNNFHPYVGASITDYLSVGAYYNSESHLSKFIGLQIDLSEDISIEGGLVTGYSQNKIQPMVKLNYKNVFISPATESIDGRDNVGIVIGLDWRY